MHLRQHCPAASRRLQTPFQGGRHPRRCRVLRAHGEGEGVLTQLVAKASELCAKQGAKLQRQAKALGAELASAVTPRERGDMTDWALMITATVVFTLMSAQLYRLYAFMCYPHLFH